ncbi:MAG TPA: hypothetical protein VMR28_00320 [Candidatus Saccharimonadales bacterium]|nr:hypothetical protein [Candidatus Saccharimonadales bacterium]
MAEAADINVEGLRFWLTEPTAIAARFTGEIQPLRADFYAEELDRTPEEVEYFVGRLTVSSWSRPDTVARHGTLRVNPRVAVAVNQDTSRIVALVHGYDEVSSTLPGVLGEAERTAKLKLPVQPFLSKDYLAFSEYIHDKENGYVIPVLVALMLEGVKAGRTASWRPYVEEKALRNHLGRWSMQPNRYSADHPNLHLRGEIEIEEKATFGPDARLAEEETWTAPVLQMRMNIWTLPGLREALETAHKNMPA